MNDLKTMTIDQLAAEAKALKAQAFTAAQYRRAAAFGRINRRLDAVYREQDSRKRGGK